MENIELFDRRHPRRVNTAEMHDFALATIHPGIVIVTGVSLGVSLSPAFVGSRASSQSGDGPILSSHALMSPMSVDKIFVDGMAIPFVDPVHLHDPAFLRRGKGVRLPFPVR
jgi:hypothetical protein